MCGIVGFTGRKEAAPILLDGLKKLEYRGYDSAGLAIQNEKAEIQMIKAKGRLEHLIEKTQKNPFQKGCCGIGHTRWATHGKPSEENAHPHATKDKNIVLVHNGIIENYQEIKEKLLQKGYGFYSETDTECIVKLLDYYYQKYQQGPMDALTRTMMRVRGSYALAVLFHDYPGEIWVARKDSPMVIGITEEGSLVASDVPAILRHTRKVYYIGNLEIARLLPEKVDFFNLDGEKIEKDLVEITWDEASAEKDGYEHFMIKEIYEQPSTIKHTLQAVVRNDKVDLSYMGLSRDALKEFGQVYIIGCGSAYHVGCLMQYVMEDMARLPVRTELASEFRYRNPILKEQDLCVLISQSGETADTLAALREAKRQGVKTLAIVNVVGSSIAREADYVFYTVAGPEISVATTKAYSTQLIAGYLLSMEFASVRGFLGEGNYQGLMNALQKLPQQIEEILQKKEQMQHLAAKAANAKDVFFIGRGLDYATCMEGSLKLKEISYIHAESYAAGELKHGSISLIEHGTLLVGVLTQEDLLEKSLSNLMEAKSRGAFIAGITNEGQFGVEESVDVAFFIPQTDRYFRASLSIVPLQLFAYYVSVAKGLDVDKPRNLAKSVTVE